MGSAMKPLSNRIFVPGLLVLATLVVIVNAWFAFRAVNALFRSEQLVEHTWQVINQVERIMGLAKDAETGTRGFIITGDDDYLQPYNAALLGLPAEFDRFQFLTRDNPSQQRRIGEMRAVTEQRLSLLREAIDLERAGSAETVHSFILNGTGKTEMDNLRRIADDAEQEERRLLATRTAHAESDSNRARYTVGIASLIDFILIVFTFRYIAH